MDRDLYGGIFERKNTFRIMNLFSHIGSFFGSFTRPYPARDWFAALLTVFFFFLALAFYGVYAYFSIETGAFLKNADSGAPSAIKVSKNDIETVVGAYRARAAAWSAHTLPAPQVTDPSGAVSKK